MIKLFLTICTFLWTFPVSAQPSRYTTQNAHSHNDYEQDAPFWAAYNKGFGSIEADIFLTPGNDHLLVAHTPAELISKKRSFDSLYLIPLAACIRKNKGTPYNDRRKKLQLLIDIKTAPIATLNKLIETLMHYPELTSTPQLQFVISGNRPGIDSFNLYPQFIMFDGEFGKNYKEASLARLVLMSANIRSYTNWNGKGNMPEMDLIKLKAAIQESHRMNKPVRFWNAPDDVNAWEVLMQAGVDLINTDKINELAGFLAKLPAS
ncbi:MAG: phosphatidylinositol-specific phospholipase C/glycerophosphodiester phosphodiesterase family protein [Chitinophagaceae bacterium]